MYFRIFATYLEKVILCNLMHGATFLLQHTLTFLLFSKLRTRVVLWVRLLATIIDAPFFVFFMLPLYHTLTLGNDRSIWGYVDVSLMHLRVVFLYRGCSYEVVQFEEAGTTHGAGWVRY
jgi:hypothetical protein